MILMLSRRPLTSSNISSTCQTLHWFLTGGKDINILYQILGEECFNLDMSNQLGENPANLIFIVCRYGSLMVEGLTSEEVEDSVVLLVVRQLRRCASDDDLVRLVTARGLVQHIIR